MKIPRSVFRRIARDIDSLVKTTERGHLDTINELTTDAKKLFYLNNLVRCMCRHLQDILDKIDDENDE